MNLNIDQSIRHQLIVLARSKKTRITENNPNRPARWFPEQIHNPEGVLDKNFTDASAWEYIANLLESGLNLPRFGRDV